MTSLDYKIYPHVKMGAACEIGVYAVIGVEVNDKQGHSLHTTIGKAAIIRSHTVIYAGNVIGDHFATGHNVLIRELNQIGHHVSIGSSSVIEHHVVIGNNVRIHSQAFIPEYSILEEGCWIGPNVVLTNAKYPNRPDTKANLQGVVIGKGAVVGANVTILPGIKIGEKALIGAGAVVTKDVPPNVVCIGSPANVVRQL